MLAGDRRHLHLRHQALGGNPGSVGLRANPPSRRTVQNLEPACAASCWDVVAKRAVLLHRGHRAQRPASERSLLL